MPNNIAITKREIYSLQDSLLHHAENNTAKLNSLLLKNINQFEKILFQSNSYIYDEYDIREIYKESISNNDAINFYSQVLEIFSKKSDSYTHFETNLFNHIKISLEKINRELDYASSPSFSENSGMYIKSVTPPNSQRVVPSGYGTQDTVLPNKGSSASFQMTTQIPSENSLSRDSLYVSGANSKNSVLSARRSSNLSTNEDIRRQQNNGYWNSYSPMSNSQNLYTVNAPNYFNEVKDHQNNSDHSDNSRHYNDSYAWDDTGLTPPKNRTNRFNAWSDDSSSQNSTESNISSNRYIGTRNEERSDLYLRDFSQDSQYLAHDLISLSEPSIRRRNHSENPIDNNSGRRRTSSLPDLRHNNVNIESNQKTQELTQYTQEPKRRGATNQQQNNSQDRLESVASSLTSLISDIEVKPQIKTKVIKFEFSPISFPAANRDFDIILKSSAGAFFYPKTTLLNRQGLPKSYQSYQNRSFLTKYSKTRPSLPSKKTIDIEWQGLKGKFDLELFKDSEKLKFTNQLNEIIARSQNSFSPVNYQFDINLNNFHYGFENINYNTTKGSLEESLRRIRIEAIEEALLKYKENSHDLKNSLNKIRIFHEEQFKSETEKKTLNRVKALISELGIKYETRVTSFSNKTDFTSNSLLATNNSTTQQKITPNKEKLSRFDITLPKIDFSQNLESDSAIFFYPKKSIFKRQKLPQNFLKTQKQNSKSFFIIKDLKLRKVQI